MAHSEGCFHEIFRKRQLLFFGHVSICMVPEGKGAFKCYVTLFPRKLDPHPPPRNANNIVPYTFVTLFSRKCDNPHRHLRYVTFESPRWGGGGGGGGRERQRETFNTSLRTGWINAKTPTSSCLLRAKERLNGQKKWLKNELSLV